MADQFQPRGCTSAAGTSWWTAAVATTSSTSTSCSTDLISWPPPPVSSSHDHSPPPSITNTTFIRSSSRVEPPPAPSALMEMDLGLSSPAMEWTTAQPFFGTSGGGGGGGSSFQSLLRDDVISRPFLQDHHFLSTGVNGGGSGCIPLLPAVCSGGLLPSSLVQGLYNSEPSQSSSGKLPAPQKQPLQFANDAPFWSPSASGAVDGRHERPPQLAQREASSYSTDLIVKTMEKTTTRSGGEPETKKPRLGTPSPLPTFKVRKEKLGDRITALQQLVAPFGKTDTASVLHEAIEYIKFLHDQVRVLSDRYLNDGHGHHDQVQQIKRNLEKSKDISEGGDGEDLRGRGLCLVPIPSTFAAANGIPPDIWSPTFIGSFR